MKKLVVLLVIFITISCGPDIRSINYSVQEVNCFVASSKASWSIPYYEIKGKEYKTVKIKGKNDIISFYPCESNGGEIRYYPAIIKH